VLPCVAVCCGVLQGKPVPMGRGQGDMVGEKVLPCVAVCCRVMHGRPIPMGRGQKDIVSVAACGRALQCIAWETHPNGAWPRRYCRRESVAVCCSVLLCVAVCCMGDLSQRGVAKEIL